MSTFVSVGNAHQPFKRLLNAVTRIAADLPQPVRVQHGYTPFSNAGCIATPFLEMAEFERLIAESDLVITHAGAGSVIHALKARKVPVIVPRQREHGEHIDDHQIAFAAALASDNRAVLVNDCSRLMAGAIEAIGQQATLPPAAITRMSTLVASALGH